MLLPEEFDGGDAGGGGLTEPMAEIEPGGFGIPEGTTLQDWLDHGQRIPPEAGGVKRGTSLV